jgi:hypothetical protein
MFFVVRVVAVQLTEAITVVAVSKHYMWVGQHLVIGNLIEEEGGIVVPGLRMWTNRL